MKTPKINLLKTLVKRRDVSPLTLFRQNGKIYMAVDCLCEVSFDGVKREYLQIEVETGNLKTNYPDVQVEILGTLDIIDEEE